MFFQLRIQRRNLQCLFHLCSDNTQCTFYKICCFEACAFINFAESGVANPVCAWEGMADHERQDWIPVSDNPQDWIKERPDWRVKILWTGWPMLCASNDPNLPTYPPLWKALTPTTQISPESLERLQTLLRNHSETFEFKDANFLKDLENHVLQVHAFHTIRMDFMMDLGQVMHGLAAMAKSACGDRWVEDVVLQSWSIAERCDKFSLFPRASLILTVLHDNNHWALLCILVGQGLISYHKIDYGDTLQYHLVHMTFTDAI